MPFHAQKRAATAAEAGGAVCNKQRLGFGNKIRCWKVDWTHNLGTLVGKNSIVGGCKQPHLALYRRDAAGGPFTRVPPARLAGLQHWRVTSVTV